MSSADHHDLAEFTRTGSASAFERLARRHADLVYSVCLRRLGSPQDAEDAAQAVFMILARKASTVRPESLGSWLHGVAIRTALKAAEAAATRTRHEMEASKMRSSATSSGEAPEAAWETIRPHLDAAVGRLPGKLREAVVRHYFEGASFGELAAELGVPSGTVASRVNAGLARLRSGLVHRGVTLGAAVLGPALLANAQVAAPAALVASLPKLATAGMISVQATALAEGVLKMMFWAKVKVAAAVVGAILVVSAGGGAVAVKLAAGESAAPATTPSAPAAPAPSPRAAALPANQWVAMKEPNVGAQMLGWDEIRYVPELEGVLFYGAYRSYTSENQNALWLYRFKENRWRMLHINMFVNRDEMCSDGGHTSGKMVYDQARKVLVYSGLVSMSRNDRFRTWVFDPFALAGWDANPPAPTANVEYEAASAYLPDLKVAFQYKLDRGAWAYDVAANQWKQLAPAGPGPQQRCDAVYDPKRKRVLAFGGVSGPYTGPHTYYNDLWAFDPNAKTWQKLEAKNPPPGRYFPQMALSTAADALLLTGGLGDGKGEAPWLTDTWALDLESMEWAPLETALPAKTFQSNHMEYDPVNDVFLCVLTGPGSYGCAMHALRYQGKRPAKPQPPAVAPLPVYDLKALPKLEGEWVPLGNEAVSAVGGWAFRPSLASNGKELLLAFGEYDPPGRKAWEAFCDVYAFKYAGGQWTKLGTRAVSDRDIHSQAPAAAFDAAGKPVVAYQAIRPWVPAAIVIKRFEDDWKPVGSLKIGEKSLIAGLPALAGGSGPLAVAWQHHPDQGCGIDSYVAENSGETWQPVAGGKALNVGDPQASRGQLASIARDGQGRLVAAWQEQTVVGPPAPYGGANATPERIHVRRLEGGKWVELAKELPASSPQARQVGYAMTLHDGEPAVAVCEGLRGERASLLVYVWKGGQWQKLGDGPLNVLGAEGGALKPGIVSDGKNLFVAWPEFQINRPPLLFVKKWDGTKWTLVGGPLNEQPGKGSAHNPVMAVLAGKPVVAWTEHDFESDRLRQLFAKVLK